MNHTYVVYITFYRGNLLPPFYIGKSIKSKVLAGYNGSVSSKEYKVLWQQERRDHPELFKTEILSHHATDEEALLREEALHRFYNVPNNPAFINMAISRGRFGDSSPKSEEHRQKIRLSNMGHPVLEETKQKLRKPKSEATKQKLRKPKSEEHKQKMRKPHSKEHNENNSKAHIGQKAWNKGRPHTPEAIQKMRNSKRARDLLRAHAT